MATTQGKYANPLVRGENGENTVVEGRWCGIPVPDPVQQTSQCMPPQPLACARVEQESSSKTSMGKQSDGKTVAQGSENPSPDKELTATHTYNPGGYPPDRHGGPTRIAEGFFGSTAIRGSKKGLEFPSVEQNLLLSSLGGGETPSSGSEKSDQSSTSQKATSSNVFSSAEDKNKDSMAIVPFRSSVDHYPDDRSVEGGKCDCGLQLCPTCGVATEWLRKLQTGMPHLGCEPFVGEVVPTGLSLILGD